jgi:hypothetical protein
MVLDLPKKQPVNTATTPEARSLFLMDFIWFSKLIISRIGVDNLFCVTRGPLIFLEEISLVVTSKYKSLSIFSKQTTQTLIWFNELSVFSCL